MTDTTSNKLGIDADSAAKAINRRTMVAGLGAAGLAAAVLPGVAHAGISATPSVDSAGLISIAGRITNSLGAPEKRAYVEIMQNRVRDWQPGATAASIEVKSWDTPDWMGVWTDDDGVFGLHTWWAYQPVDAGSLVSKPPRQAEVRFNVETADGRRLMRTMWLDANPSFASGAANDPAS